MFKIIFQILLLIYIVFLIFNILDLKKYNVNGFIKQSNDLEDIEEKLTNGKLNDGEYLDKCNSLKKQYDNIKFASM